MTVVSLFCAYVYAFILYNIFCMSTGKNYTKENVCQELKAFGIETFKEMQV